MKTYDEKIMKKLWFLKNNFCEKHSMVIFQRKNILWLFFKEKTYYGYFSKKKHIMVIFQRNKNRI